MWNADGTLLSVRYWATKCLRSLTETLQQVYDRVLLGLNGLEAMSPTDAKAELNTLVQLLEDGTYILK